MKKNAFTLIELLAVIVILAIIALIAVPVVINIINDAKKSSEERSIDLYIDYVQKAIIKEQMIHTGFNPNTCEVQENGNLMCGDVEVKMDMKGAKASGGTIIFEKDKISAISELIFNNKKYDYNINRKTKLLDTTTPGLYDENYKLLATWDELENYGFVISDSHNYPGDKESSKFKTVLNNNPNLEKGKILIIPSSVTSIGVSAFDCCTNLTVIIIPNGFISIGAAAFWGCTGLTSITIPNSVTYIGESVFQGCTGLTSITIPNSVTYIGQGAFRGCTGLTNITIPNSVTYIGNNAFNGCTSLTSITIPNSVTGIGQGAFRDCTGLTSITIPNSVTYIGESVFNGCTGLTSVTFENTAGWFVTSINYATSGNSIDVTNASTNATNLKDTYKDKYWKRN